MKMLRKISMFMAALFIFCLLPVTFPQTITTAEVNDKVYVKIRYEREDGNYEKWNIWQWEKDKDGSQADFIGQDSEGMFAVIETTKEAESLNFIIRKGEWEDKATEDESVDLSNGDIEVVIKQGESGVVREEREIKRSFDKINLSLHYFRADGNYEDYKVSAGIDDMEKSNYSFDTEDDYGKSALIALENVENANAINFVIDGDIEAERSINTAYADNEGNVSAYLVQNDEKVYFNSTEPVRYPKVTYFRLDSEDEMNFKVNKELKGTENIVLKKDKKIVNKSKYTLTLKDNKLGGKIVLNDGIDLKSKYTLEIEGYEGLQASFGNIFGTSKFEKAYKYTGELGAIYSPKNTKFILWAPTAEKVKLVFYGTDGNDYQCAAKKTVDMKKGSKGEWTYKENGNLDGMYYNYLVTVDGVEREVVDPYAKAVGVNGDRSMVVNLKSTDPEGWNNDKKPKLDSPNDAIIYEMHVRDFSIDENSGVPLEYRGKFKGVWQKDTVIPGTDVKTGVAHLKELGVNVVHILPAYDFGSIDETRDDGQYNWGYDPKNYNAPEGSYSTDPYNGKIRIKEFKEMVNELHKQGIKVVMDVVYNHTYSSDDSVFQRAVPEYYYRHDEEGNLTNGSGCGNEIATERYMARRYIVDSVKYWAKEYHLDGFRFDLMAVYDIDTVKMIRKELDKIDKSILMYGEGWTGGTSALETEKSATKANCPKFGKMQVAMFSDDLRDGLKGHVFTENAPAFINGASGFEETIKFGIVGSTQHDGIDYSKVNYSEEPWANEPYQTISYVSCHDNFTLYDRLQKVTPDASDDLYMKENKLAAAVIYTSQGIPLMQAGEEFARTKTDEEGNLIDNSYISSDFVNKMDWNRVSEYSNLYDYYKGLMSIRNNHKAFKMSSTKDIQKNLKFLKNGTDFNGENVVAYTLNGKNVKDRWKNIAVMFNSSDKDVEVTLPQSGWTIVVNGDKAGTSSLGTVEGNKVILPAKTSYVLVDTKSYEKTK